METHQPYSMVESFFHRNSIMTTRHQEVAPPPKSMEIPNKSPSPPPSTGKSLSEALIFAENGENMLCTKIVQNIRISVHNIFSPGLSLEFSSIEFIIQ